MGCTLANTIEPSMCGGDTAFLSNYFEHLLKFCMEIVLCDQCFSQHAIWLVLSASSQLKLICISSHLFSV